MHKSPLWRRSSKPSRAPDFTCQCRLPRSRQWMLCRREASNSLPSRQAPPVTQINQHESSLSRRHPGGSSNCQCRAAWNLDAHSLDGIRSRAVFCRHQDPRSVGAVLPVGNWPHLHIIKQSRQASSAQSPIPFPRSFP